MSDVPDNQILKKSLYTAWAFMTLVLVITLVLMVIELAQARNSSSGMSDGYQAAYSSQVATSGVSDTPEIALYFGHADMVLLTSEPRRIELTPNTLKNCRRALEALIQGPIMHNVPVIPSSTRVRGMFLLENGELIIDFSRELEAGHVKSASSEWLWSQAIAHTLTQDVLIGQDGISVREIRFLFEGAPPQSSFPQHIDVREPISPSPSAISSVVETLGNA